MILNALRFPSFIQNVARATKPSLYICIVIYIYVLFLKTYICNEKKILFGLELCNFVLGGQIDIHYINCHRHLTEVKLSIYYLLTNLI